MMLTRRKSLALLAGSLLAACDDRVVAPKKDEADPLIELATDGARPDTVRIGITPSRGKTTHELLAPLYEYLSAKLDRNVAGVTAESYEQLSSLVREQKVELGVFSPAAYVTARSSLDAIAIATATRNGSPTYLGYLVTQRQKVRPLLTDLRGRTIAWVNKNSTSGYIYPRAMLRAKGIDPDTFFGKQIFAGDHEASVKLAMEDPELVAAAASPFVNPETPTMVQDAFTSLMVVAKTKRIPLDCIVIHKRMQRALAADIRTALLDLVFDHAISYKLDVSWGLDGFVRPMRYDEVARVMAG